MTTVTLEREQNRAAGHDDRRSAAGHAAPHGREPGHRAGSGRDGGWYEADPGDDHWPGVESLCVGEAR